MSNTGTDVFENLSAIRDNPDAMLGQMVEHFRQSRQPLELFEAMKMQIRHKLQLPLIAGENDPEQTEEIERQLEFGLLDACREAGSMLIEQGRISEGWMYLRPIGKNQLAQELLGKIKINDDNYDEMIQVLLHEGVDVGRGYQAVLDHQGTCNSITLFEQTISQRSKSDQQIAAARLLDHLHGELCEMVRNDIAERGTPVGDDVSLVQMIDDNPAILSEGGYHLDTTHLSSTVRIATCLEDESQLRKAWELTQYGRRLNHQFQYPGDEPFVDFYPAYRTFFATLLGEDVEAGLKYFQRKAKSVDATQHGTGAIETYVDLLDRVGRHQQAIKAAVDLVPHDVPAQRIIPLLIDIASKGKAAGDDAVFEPVLNYCQDHNDLLGYAAALHAAGG